MVADGPTMLKIITETINPTMIVGFGNLMQDIEMATMAKFSENIDELVDFMLTMYNEILDKGEMYPHFLMYFSKLYSQQRTIFSGRQFNAKETIGILEKKLLRLK